MIGSTNFTPQKDIRRSAAIWRGARSIRPSAVTCSVATWPMRVRPALCSCTTGFRGDGQSRIYATRNNRPRHILAEYLRADTEAPHWMSGTLLRYWLHGSMPEFADMPEDERRSSAAPWLGANADDFTLDEVKALRREWQDVLVLKGISTAEDARRAVELVRRRDHRLQPRRPQSRQLGALVRRAAEVVDAAASKAAVMVDGGFRRGVDVPEGDRNGRLGCVRGTSNAVAALRRAVRPALHRRWRSSARRSTGRCADRQPRIAS